MEQTENILKKFLGNNNSKIRKFVIIALVGICLMVIVWPESREKNEAEQKNSSNKIKEASEEIGGDSGEAYGKVLEENLEEVLSQVSGVGQVKVMITLKDNGEKVTLKDESLSESTAQDSTSKTSSEQTVITGENSEERPYVFKVENPEIEGVLVSCEGGGNLDVVTQITEAVQALFDVPAHKIVVLELK